MPGRTTPRYSYVELEMDPKTKVVQTARLERQFHGSSVGKLRFQLVETGQLPDDQYTLSGHLDADAVIVDRDFPRQGPLDFRSRMREEVLKRLQFQAGAGMRK